MRPRLIGRGFEGDGAAAVSEAPASMRPRLIGRGFVPTPFVLPAPQAASMRPRLIGRGFAEGYARGRGELPGFNEAASDRTRIWS